MNQPLISQNVFDILLELYPSKSQEKLAEILSSTPRVSILRVSKDHEDREEILHKFKTEDYHVQWHPKVFDALVISKKSPRNHDMPQGKEVVVDVSCGAAVLRGADVFAPGVLAAEKGMQSGDRVSVFADLEQKCRRGLTTEYVGRKFFVANGIALLSRQQLFQNNATVSGVAISILKESRRHPTLSKSLGIFPQNFPSLLVGHTLNPRDGEIILDMCAAPGGKSTHIGELLKGKAGVVVSIDKTERKVIAIKENIELLDLDNIKCYSYDSTKLLVNKANENKSVLEGPPFSKKSFDKVLLDPPCSGLGQRPQMRYVKTAKELSSFSIYQRKLISVAVEVLKEDGILVYSTCTLLPDENERQVAWILYNFPQMKLIAQEEKFGRSGLPGYGLSESDCAKVQRFDWLFAASDNTMFSDENIEDLCKDSIGFFIAKFVKLKE